MSHPADKGPSDLQKLEDWLNLAAAQEALWRDFKPSTMPEISKDVPARQAALWSAQRASAAARLRQRRRRRRRHA